MRSYNNRKLLFFIGLLTITLLFSFYHLYLLDYFETTSRKPRHIIRLGAILLVYGTGWWVIKRTCPGWLTQVWHLLYAVNLVILLTIGLYYWYFTEMSIPFHDIAISLTEFSLSPAPYIIIAILNRSLARVPG
jgi:hypothetical protein